MNFGARLDNIGATAPLVTLGNGHIVVNIDAWLVRGFPREADAWGATTGRNNRDELRLAPRRERSDSPTSPAALASIHQPDLGHRMRQPTSLQIHQPASRHGGEGASNRTRSHPPHVAANLVNQLCGRLGGVAMSALRWMQGWRCLGKEPIKLFRAKVMVRRGIVTTTHFPPSARCSPARTPPE